MLTSFHYIPPAKEKIKKQDRVEENHSIEHICNCITVYNIFIFAKAESTHKGLHNHTIEKCILIFIPREK